MYIVKRNCIDMTENMLSLNQDYLRYSKRE